MIPSQFVTHARVAMAENNGNIQYSHPGVKAFLSATRKVKTVFIYRRYNVEMYDVAVWTLSIAVRTSEGIFAPPKLQCQA